MQHDETHDIQRGLLLQEDETHEEGHSADLCPYHDLRPVDGDLYPVPDRTGALEPAFGTLHVARPRFYADQRDSRYLPHKHPRCLRIALLRRARLRTASPSSTDWNMRQRVRGCSLSSFRNTATNGKGRWVSALRNSRRTNTTVCCVI